MGGIAQTIKGEGMWFRTDTYQISIPGGSDSDFGNTVATEDKVLECLVDVLMRDNGWQLFGEDFDWCFLQKVDRDSGVKIIVGYQTDLILAGDGVVLLTLDWRPNFLSRLLFAGVANALINSAVKAIEKNFRLAGLQCKPWP